MGTDAVKVGAAVGRYRLQERLSRGGMGEVWRAYDLTLGRPVALKLLRAGLADPVDRERFLREARAAAQLNHPNIVAIFDVGEWEGCSYLVMELLEGRSLADVLAERGPLPVEDVRRYGAQAAAGLAAAHARGVVHRDIKPSNLMLASDGTLKLVDFGIARVLDEASSRLTATGTIVGTASYVAPEQARGLQADARTDLYALGCVLYQLLVGRTPFVGAPTEVLYAHLYTEPEPLTDLRPDVPPDLVALVHGLLAKDPNDRPAEAGVVREALLEAGVSPTALTMPLDSPVLSRHPRGQGDAPGMTRKMPLAGVLPPDDDDALPPDGSACRPGRGPLAAALVLAAAGVAAVALLWPDGGLLAPDHSTARETPSSNVSSPEPTTTTAEPSPTETEGLPPRGSEEWLLQLDAMLRQMADRGEIKEKVADRLRREIGDVLEKQVAGERAEMRKELRDLNRELVKAYFKRELPITTKVSDLIGDVTIPSEENVDGPAEEDFSEDGRGDRRHGRG